MSDPVTATELAPRIADAIRDGFEQYHARFAAITARARVRFQQRDWAAARHDAVERIALYDQCIAEQMDALRRLAGDAISERALWLQVHAHFSALLQGLIDAELYKTFYNTLSRRLFAIRGVDPEVEFIAFDVEPSDAITHPVARHTYAV
ncbi:isocitrate dehydrogenase kinase/phosphatase AceK regulatory subunit, partial [Stenotrophomonas sp. 2YAF22]